MTAYVAIYDDSEFDPALPGTRPVVEIHRRLEIPATFGIVTKPLEDNRELRAAYLELLGDPALRGLIEVIPHSHTHPIFAHHKSLGGGISDEMAQFEISRSKELIEEWFGGPVKGFRSTNGYFGGWGGQTKLLQTLTDNGIQYLSSFAMGPGDTVPAPLTQPYYYAEDEFPGLLEVPGHDWHDNVLNGWPPLRSAWPPCVPAGLPNRMPETPREKFEIYRPNLDWAVENKLAFYSPALHPFSIHQFEPAATWVEMLLTHARDIGMHGETMTQFADRWRGENPPTA